MKLKAFLLLFVAIAFAGSSLLVPFGGFEPDQFPVPQDDPPVQPAGYAFAIWGLIYLWLIISAALGAWRHAEDPAWDAARPPLIASLGVGMFWLPVAKSSVEIATLLIWAMLILALSAAIKASRQALWSFAAPVALYAGWLTAASSVSIGLIGAGYGIGPDQVGWAMAAILLALAIFSAAVARVAAPWAYAGALIWALTGLVVQNADGPPIVMMLALVGIGACLTLTFLHSRKKEAA